MKARPILFSKDMATAIVNGTKTQTRRVIKGIPDDFRVNVEKFCKGIEVSASDLTYDDMAMDALLDSCPYGKVGDILYGRETFAYLMDNEILYKASEDGNLFSKDPLFKWKPSIFMPKKASRIWLQITDIRVERLLDISEKDAIAEGIEEFAGLYRNYFTPNEFPGAFSAKDSYFSLWDAINGKDSHKINPWVWVVEFENIGFEKAMMLLTHGEKS